MRKILACCALFLGSAMPASAISLGLLGLVQVEVTEDSVSVAVSLPGGLSADLNLDFEQVQRLNLLSLGPSVRLFNPSDPALLSRLPAGVVPAGLPVMLRIEPPPIGGLSFNGITNFEIHTVTLHYTPGSPYRVFSAPVGGPFRDITTEIGAGSYRARANTGGFSEFLIVSDSRPVDQVITVKLNDLEAILDAYESSLPSTIYDDLEERLEEARVQYVAGATAEAIDEIDAFLLIVEQHSGTDIPDVWRAARDRHNVAGYLRAGAKTLRFSLALKNGL